MTVYFPSKSHLSMSGCRKSTSHFDVKGSFKLSSTKYLRQSRKTTKGFMNFIYLLLNILQKSHKKCLCPLQLLTPKLGENLGSTWLYMLLSGFHIDILREEDWRTKVPGRAKSYSLWSHITWQTNTIASSFETLPGQPGNKEEPTEP